MKLQIKELRVPIKNKNRLKYIIAMKYNIQMSDIADIIITRKSIDARKRDNVFVVYNLMVDMVDEIAIKLLDNKFITRCEENSVEMNYPKYPHNDRPIIVGFGPAGIFCALYLARCGASPIIIERGSKMDERIKEVEVFLKDKILNCNSNVQFGEGGAGTFSDGKLTTNLKDPLIQFILKEFVAHGAPKEILYESKPHIGTDYLAETISKIREEIIELGGEFFFNHTFKYFSRINNELIVGFKGNEEMKTIKTRHLILGLGHSARDTLTMLHHNKILMEPKSFSMGVRIEHTQEYINKIQYKEYAAFLPAADYKLAVHFGDRSLYTFCMCPGGIVMASASEEGTILTNGMSRRSRNDINANSALLVNVDPKDYYVDNVLDGLKFQEKYEKLAFEISKDYRAPANLVKEFLNKEVAKEVRSVKPSYPHGIVFADFRKCLPLFVVDTLRKGIEQFNYKMNGFVHDDAILIGIETRSSCPVRIIRDENREASIKGIYPIGEGAGYAGGITSAALDGLKTAMQIVKEETCQ